jgi:para-nitrobenzyl esterase
MMNHLAAVVLSLSLVGCNQLSGGDIESNPATVRISQGALKGELSDGIVAFKGIPFAAPPVGPLRWKPPQPAPGWPGMRQARDYGPACPQPIRTDAGGGGRADVQDEDCLTLNVWAPLAAKGLPVMVWIHGGAYRLGSGSYPIYDGSMLARQGVVLVTINYRLGDLGYFAHPALTAEVDAKAPLGNYGMMDQVAALKWVQDNIADFGGDPFQTTVFGESAGGGSVVHLLANPNARGLFARAIVQSGGGLTNPAGLGQQEKAGIASALRVGLGEKATAQDLRAVPAATLIEAQGSVQGSGSAPFIDGRYITEAPWRAFAAGRDIDVPLVIGANSNDASVMSALGVPPASAAIYVGGDVAKARPVYGEGLSQTELANQILGDAWFAAPARWIADSASKGAPSFLYHFSYVAEERRAQSAGANHGSEIPYIFQTWDRLPSLTGGLSADDRAFATSISACWVAFAKTGIPGCAIAPDWPPYSAARDQLVEFGPKTDVQKNFRKAQHDLLLEQFFARVIK